MSPPTWPTKTIIGVESCAAVWMPMAALAAPGSPRDEGESRAAGQLAVGFGHVGGAAFLPADDEAKAIAHVVHARRGRPGSFRPDAERQRGALCEQAGDEDFSARSGGHGRCGTCAVPVRICRFYATDRRCSPIIAGNRPGTSTHAYLRHHPRRHRCSPPLDCCSPSSRCGARGRCARAWWTMVVLMALGLVAIWLLRRVRRRHREPDTGDRRCARWTAGHHVCAWSASA